jgi:hypothetical protein
MGLFLSVVIVGKLLCAGDYLGNLWILEPTPRALVADTSRTIPLRLFCSYAHADEALRAALETHLANLQRQGLIEHWHHRDISAGADRARTIDEHLERADVIVLLVSADFLASGYIFDVELARAMEKHHTGNARVIPILIRPCDWSGAPFGELPALPKDAKPVTTWPNQDEAWTDIAKGIRRAVEDIRARRT